MLPSRLLKDGAKEISKPLTHMINRSLSECTIPIEWKHAKITPIHKSGTLDNPDNYRPISVLPVLSKILEKCVQEQYVGYLENNKLLSNIQFGYRKKRSTELAVNLFLDDVRKCIDKGNMVGALFVDLSLAFDTIGHGRLLDQLPTMYGIKDKELEWFENYLFNRSQYVFYEKEASNVMNLKCGVPQGSILGPILFLLFFNDLVDHLEKVKVLKLADDTVMYFSDKDFFNIESTLNSDIHNLYRYLYDNELIINLKQTKLK